MEQWGSAGVNDGGCIHRKYGQERCIYCTKNEVYTLISLADAEIDNEMELAAMER